MSGIPDCQKLEYAQNANQHTGTLKENIKKSNGRLIDETGNKYNMLTVIRYYGSGKMFGSGKHDGGAAWLCKCDCGKETVALGTKLRMGISKSCGCYNRVGFGEGAFNSKFSVLRFSAKKRRYVWELSKDQFRKIASSNCAYCGLKPSNIEKGRTSVGDFVYSGIDRVDNSIGYKIENVVPCCANCNRAKMTMSLQEFTSWVKRLAVHNNWTCDINSIKIGDLWTLKNSNQNVQAAG